MLSFFTYFHLWIAYPPWQHWWLYQHTSTTTASKETNIFKNKERHNIISNYKPLTKFNNLLIQCYHQMHTIACLVIILISGSRIHSIVTLLLESPEPWKKSMCSSAELFLDSRLIKLTSLEKLFHLLSFFYAINVSWGRYMDKRTPT
jgi:hypothetical protein